MYLIDDDPAPELWEPDVPPEYRFTESEISELRPERSLWLAYPSATSPVTPRSPSTDPASGSDPVARLLDAVIPSGRATLTVEEAAQVVGLGRSSAYDAVKRGDLPSRRVNGRLLVPVPALLHWLGAAPTNAAPEAV